MTRLVFALGLLLATLTTADAARSRNWRDCTIDKPGPLLGSLDRSIVGCTAIIKAGKTSKANRAIAYYNRGLAYYHKNKYPWAINDLKLAIKLNPTYAKAYYILCLAYYKTGQRSHGIGECSKAIKLDPEYVEAFYARGRAWEDGDSNGSAIRDYRKVLELKTGHEKAKNALKRLEEHNKRLDEANQLMRYCTSDEPDRSIESCTAIIKARQETRKKRAIAYHNRGFAYYKKGKYSRAIADYDKAIELNPKFAIAYGNRGIAYYNNGVLDRAKADFREALAIDPSLDVVRNNLTRLGMAP